jgi:ABC-2 type transport system permease protein
MSLLTDNWVMLGRQYRLLVRQPIWIFIMLVQPMIWLVLYSQLFHKLPRLGGGFGTGSYIEYLTPGVVVMTSFFGGMWSGMSTVNELEHGVYERFLATPIGSSSLVVSQVLRAGITGAAEGVVILLVGLALGAHVHGGVLGWLVILLVALVVGAAFSGISHSFALLMRREETVIAVANFVGLPLMFLSTMLISPGAMPSWIRHVAAANPVNWAAEAARAVELPGTDWGGVAEHLGLLFGVTALTLAWALSALRRYRASL